MASKASHADWRDAVRSATGPAPTPAPSATPPIQGTTEDRRVQLGTYVPEPILLQLKELSVKLARGSGRRVTISDIVTEALREFIEKHEG